jgi:hypothetical protein
MRVRGCKFYFKTMNKFKQEYLRKVMKFKEERIELTDKQRKFLEYAYDELRSRITTMYYQYMYGNRIPHTPSPHGELTRLNFKSSNVHSIIQSNSYSLTDRTLLLRLRNYHLRR